jgi:hypothetical protein
MGQSKRRREQLGDVYGTPEGRNRPIKAMGTVWPGLDGLGHVVLKLQAVADADGRPLAAWVPDSGTDPVEMRISFNPPDDEPDRIMWIAPTKPGAALAFRHPVWIHRSDLSGKWAINLQASGGNHVLDVFHDLRKALISAQNAQTVFGTAKATADANGKKWSGLIRAYAAADEAAGIQSDDEGIGMTEPGADGFRTLHGFGSVSEEKMGIVVDRLRQSGVHVRLP